MYVEISIILNVKLGNFSAVIFFCYFFVYYFFKLKDFEKPNWNILIFFNVFGTFKRLMSILLMLTDESSLMVEVIEHLKYLKWQTLEIA